MEYINKKFIIDVCNGIYYGKVQQCPLLRNKYAHGEFSTVMEYVQVDFSIEHSYRIYKGRV